LGTNFAALYVRAYHVVDAKLWRVNQLATEVLNLSVQEANCDHFRLDSAL
jgi:hypothetical protein